MTTTFGKGIDQSEVGGRQGTRFVMTVGSGGCTAGQPLILDTTAQEVVVSAATTDVVVGIADTTQVITDQVKVLGNGCLAQVPYTLTTGSTVGVSSGSLVNWTTGTIVGYTVAGATGSSLIRVQIQF